MVRLINRSMVPIALTDSVIESARQLVGGLYDPAVLLELPSFRVIDFNPAYATMVEQSRAVLLRRIEERVDAFSLLKHPPGVQPADFQNAIRIGAPLVFAEERVVNSSGKSFLVWIMLIPVGTTRNGPCAVIEVLRDVTAEARVHAQYHELLSEAQTRQETLQQVVDQRTLELRAALDRVTKLSRIDPLTELPNRRTLFEVAEATFALARRHGRQLAVLMCDLDRFKQINDRFGHQVGDKVLVAAAKALLTCVRDSDMVARYGGEEFAILLPDTDGKKVESVARRCLDAVRALRFDEHVPGGTGGVTMSIGIAVFPEHADSVETLVKAADDALFFAKRQGRNGAYMYGGQSVERRQTDPSLGMPKLLVMAGTAEKCATYEEILAPHGDVLACATAAEALGLCSRQLFDAIVVEQDISSQSVFEFLRESVALQPAAIRVLVLESYATLRQLSGTYVSDIDAVVLRESLATRLPSAIDEAFARRELLFASLRDGQAYVREAPQASDTLVEDIVARGDVDYVFQPIVRAKDRSVIGYEALCRPRGLRHLSVEQFFDTAARRGLARVAGRACRAALISHLKRINSASLVFVNIHPAEVRDPEFLSAGSPFLEQASRIVLEITERVEMGDYQRLAESLERVRQAGFRVALDDMGAGHSSLGAVAVLRADFIKVDRSLIKDIHRSATQQRLLGRIADFAREEHIGIIAEGVELEEEAAAVAAAGIEYMQGFCFGYPSSL